MVLIPGVTVFFDVASVKLTPTTRLACGVKVANQAPTSPLYKIPDMKSAIDLLGNDTLAAQTALDDYNKAHGAFKKARTTLGIVLGAWDTSFDIVVALSDKHCVTADDGAGLGMPVL